jgi:hypothetical protein
MRSSANSCKYNLIILITSWGGGCVGGVRKGKWENSNSFYQHSHSKMQVVFFKNLEGHTRNKEGCEKRKINY